MPVIGLDFGAKTLGVAISDEFGLMAHPVKTVAIKSVPSAVNAVHDLQTQYRFDTVVLGLPKNTDGSLGSQAQYTLKFKQALEDELELTVVLIDERFSTQEASRILHAQQVKARNQKGRIDTTAACTILQTYLDQTKQLES